MIFYAYFADSGAVLERYEWPENASLVLALSHPWARTKSELRELCALIYELHDPSTTLLQPHHSFH